MSFGKRNFEQLYETGQIIKINENGTLDVKIPARVYPYTELPCSADIRALQEGDTVVVGKAYGNPYMPFVLADTRPYKRKTRTSGPSKVFCWPNSRASISYPFMDVTGGVQISLLTDPEDVMSDPIPPVTVLGPFGLPSTKKFPYVLIGWADLSSGKRRICTLSQEAALVSDGDIKDQSFKIKVWNVDELSDISMEDVAIPVWTATIPYVFTTPWNPLVDAQYLYINQLQLQYNQDLDCLIFTTAPDTNKDIKTYVFDAASGLLLGTWIDADKKISLYKGYITTGKKLIRTAYQRIWSTLTAEEYTSLSTPLTTNTTYVLNRDIRAFSIPPKETMLKNAPSTAILSPAWARDPITLLGSAQDITAIPTYRIVSTGGLEDPYTLPANGGTVSNFNFLPGQVTCVLPKKGVVVTAHAGFEGLPDWTLEGPIVGDRYTGGTSSDPPVGLGPYWPMTNHAIDFDNWGHWFKYGIDRDNNSFGSGPNGHITPGGGTFDNTHFGSVQNDCRINRAWLTATDIETGKKVWTYEFPPLDAADEHTYVIDVDSAANAFGAISAGLTNVIDQPFADGVTADLTYSFTNTDIGFPDDKQFTRDDIASTYGYDKPPPTDADHVGRPLGAYNTLQIQFCPTFLAGLSSSPQNNFADSISFWGKFPQFKYWSTGATYRFDPQPYVFASDSIITGARSGSFYPQVRNINPQPTAGQIYSDSNENIYMAYLVPFGIVSPRCWQFSPWNADVKNPATAPAWSGKLNFIEKLNYNGFIGEDGETYNPVTSGERTFFAIPFRHTAYKSFLGSWDSNGKLLWHKELTTYHNDLQFFSPALNGKVPYAGCVLRMCITQNGLLLLRAIRLPLALTPQVGPAPARYAGLCYANHDATLFAKTILELRDPETGDMIWQKTIYDPTVDDGLHLKSAFMLGSQTSGWVVGGVEYYSGITSTGTSAAPTGPIVGKMFSCDGASEDPVVITRDMTTTDPIPDGVTPIKAAPILIGGSLFYPWLSSDDNKWYINKLEG